MASLKLLVSAFGQEGLHYVEGGRQYGVEVRVLDCLETHHKTLANWFGNAVLHVRGHRGDVSRAVRDEQFDAAIVHEDEADFVRTALITQSLREAGVPKIFVVTRDPEHRRMYLRLGAHRVIIANSAVEAWDKISLLVPELSPSPSVYGFSGISPMYGG